MSDLITIEKSHPLFTILLLNRPAKRNALNIELMNELSKRIKEVEQIENQRAIIIKGAGSVFCAGLDLQEASDHSLEEESAKAVARVLNTIYESPLVTICAVHGAAIAGGLGLIFAADLAVAESGTIFGLPETRRGLVAAQILPYALNVLSKRHLSELLLTAESIDLQRALEIGLINKVCKTYNSLPAAIKMAQNVCKGAPIATKMTKSLLKKWEPLALEDCFEIHKKMRKSDEAKEGKAAFLEKRLPNWS